MKEQNISKIYAQAFLELGTESGFDTAAELLKLTEVINESNDLENVLFLDVFREEEKISVIKAICEKLALNSKLTAALCYLVQEKRIGLLPLITKEIIVIDDHKKGFIRGVIEGSTDSISVEYQRKLTDVVKSKLGGNPVLEYKKNEAITAGYKVTVEDMQLDASIDYQLREFKRSIIGDQL